MAASAATAAPLPAAAAAAGPQCRALPPQEGVGGQEALPPQPQPEGLQLQAAAFPQMHGDDEEGGSGSGGGYDDDDDGAGPLGERTAVEQGQTEAATGDVLGEREGVPGGGGRLPGRTLPRC